MNQLRLALIKWQNFNPLPTAAGSQGWMRVATRRLRCTMSIMIPSSFIFRCTWPSALQFTPGKRSYSRKYWWRSENPCRSRIHSWGYHYRYSAAAVLLLQNPWAKWKSMHFSKESGMCTVTSYCTLLTERALFAISVRTTHWGGPTCVGAPGRWIAWCSGILKIWRNLHRYSLKFFGQGQG